MSVRNEDQEMSRHSDQLLSGQGPRSAGSKETLKIHGKVELGAVWGHGAVAKEPVTKLNFEICDWRALKMCLARMRETTNLHCRVDAA